MAKLIHPEVVVGIRLEYNDVNGSWRCGRVKRRSGNTLVVVDALNRSRRIRIEKVRGYWEKKVKASFSNF